MVLCFLRMHVDVPGTLWGGDGAGGGEELWWEGKGGEDEVRRKGIGKVGKGEGKGKGRRVVGPV